MFPGLLNLPKNNSFFLFGARGTGKSTLLRHLFKEIECLWINLLNPEEEDRFARHPHLLADLVRPWRLGIEQYFSRQKA